MKVQQETTHFLSLWSKRIMRILLFFLCTSPYSCSDHSPKEYPYKDFSIRDITSLQDKNLKTNPNKVKYYIDSLRLSEHDTTFVDITCNKYYAENSPYLWITTVGANSCCDTFLNKLKDLEHIGIPPARLYRKKLQELLHRIRQMDYDKDHSASLSLASLEYYMTKSYMRYTCGQRFGFINPSKMLNRLDHVIADSLSTPFRTLYDLHSELPGKNFTDSVFQSIRTKNIAFFLEQVQPENDLYRYFISKYNQISPNSPQKRLLAINIERSRWRHNHPNTKYSIFINIPSQKLFACNTEGDSTCTMKICFGNKKHKTPLLSSTLSHLELNPYWIIPQSIIKHEIIPHHLNDTSYFHRNKYRIIEKATGEFVPPQEITASMLLSGKYRIRQDKGGDNSLGRMIFRFPNKFSIFLHDTNNKSAFQRSVRTVSHGCIRLEKPFELARFLLGYRGKEYVDRIWEAIQDNEDCPSERKNHPLKTTAFEHPISLSIVYYTCYPHPVTKELVFYPDIYGYDNILYKLLF